MSVLSSIIPQNSAKDENTDSKEEKEDTKNSPSVEDVENLLR